MNMNMKMKLATIALSGAMLMSSTVFGTDFDPKFYVGGELQANQYNDLSKNAMDGYGYIFGRKNGKTILSKNGSGAGLFIGSRFHENVGVEAGFTAYAKQTTNLDANYSVHNFVGIANRNFRDKIVAKHNNVYADLLGYLPVCNDIDLIGSIGLGQLTSKQTVNTTYTWTGATNGTSNRGLTTKSSATGVRVGLGAQMKLSDNIGARFMVNHQKGNKIIKSVNSARLGLFYQF